MKRILKVIVFALAAIGLLAPAASAGGAPTREFLPAVGFTSDAGQLCSFPVQFDVLRQKEYLTTFTDENGNPIRALLSGSLVVKMTNVTNGHSITVNASGPGEIRFLSDGSQIARLRGLGLVFLFPGDGGGPALFLNDGVVVEKLSGPPDFHGDLISQTGERTDLCPLMA